MKTLYLIRHAKSDWGHAFLQDIDRPLNERGYRDAVYMGNFMKQKNLIPDLILSSPAIRAMSTALIFARTLPYDQNNIHIRKELYESSEGDYLKVIAETENAYQSVFLFAHNPTLTNLANHLTIPFTDNISTCGIVAIQFDMDSWKDVTLKKGQCILFDFPKNHL